MTKFTKIFNYTLLCFLLLISVLTVIDVEEVKHSTVFNQDNIYDHLELITKGPRSVIDEEYHEEAFNYIVNTLDEFGLINEDDSSRPAYVVQTGVGREENVNATDIHDILKGKNLEEDSFLYNELYNLKNVIVSLPANASEKSNDAIMIMAHYDSVATGPGASDDGVSVSIMLEAIRYYYELLNKGQTIKNDLIFAFVDGEEYGLLGSEIFIKDFKGLNNLVNRIKYAINLESRGTSGTLIMFETSSNNYNTIKLFSKINDGVFTSSIANMIYQNMPNGTDFSNYNEIYQGLNFANLGEGYNYHTQNDNYKNVGSSYLTQQANLIYNTIEETKNYDLNILYQAKEEAIFFSFLNVATIFYSKTFCYVIAILTILMIIGVVVLEIHKKRSNLVKTLKGYGVILASILASGVSVYILYYLCSLTAALFGAIDFHNIGEVTFSNIGLIVFLLLITIIITAFTTHYLIRLLSINGEDIRRSLTYFISFIGVVLSFIVPVASYMFIFTGFFLLIIELVELIWEKSRLSKLNLEVLVFALSLPIIIPINVLASDALGINLGFALAMLFTIFSLILVARNFKFLSYFSYRRLINLFKKDHKNPTFVTGFITLLGVSILALLIMTSFNPGLSTNTIGKQSSRMLPYDDALVYVVGEDESYYMVKDLDAYTSMNDQLRGYKYNKENGSYRKNDINNNLALEGLANINLSQNIMEVDRVSNSGYVEIRFENNSNIDSVSVEYDNGSVLYDLYKNEQELFSIFTIRVYNNAKIKINTINSTAIEATIDTYELIINYHPLQSYNDFINLVNIPNIKTNLIKYTKLN
jgi:hypothetical protein